MALSIIQAQRDIILGTIRNTVRGEWKVLIVDEASQKVLDTVVKEDDILNLNITNIERIENRRPVNKDMDALYFLSPQAHIVDCIMADLERRRYRKLFLIWTALLPPALRERIDRSKMAKEQIALFKVLNIEWYPRESHLVTFRDPWSFPILYHPACNHLVRHHIEDLAQKIVGVCVALGEYPTIRYYKPNNPRHEASVLCSHLARFVQEELDMYAKYHEDFPPPSNRPRGALYILDRSMDLFAPFLHEFTYQAMAHDLLPIKDGEKVTYRTMLDEGRPDAQEKEVEISEKDRIWVENRHRHMKDTIEKLMGDFQKFIDENPHFTNQTGGEAKNNLNAIKDMLAGLPQFQELKEAYSLHLTMAQECMNIFQHNKLPDLASVEQILATGLDEDFKKPKNVTDQVVRNLDEDSVSHPDRLRLVSLYLLYRDGLLPADLQKLLAHSNLPSRDSEVINNLELLGARVAKPLKDKSTFSPLFPARKPNAPTPQEETYSLSRFVPALQSLLDDHTRSTLDPTLFPYTKPPLDTESEAQSAALAATSLRSAKPTWAKPRTGAVADSRQRVIVFVAGGATYSESRACYEASRAAQREVVMVTSHMLTPGLWMRQLGDLSQDKRRLGIPAEQPKPKAPAHLFEREEVPAQGQAQAQGGQAQGGQGQRTGPAPGGLPRGPAPPVKQMAGMGLADGGQRPSGGQPNGAAGRMGLPSNPAMTAANAAANGAVGQQPGKLQKGGEADEKRKKKHHFFGSKK
ncbi:Sec1-like protein [Viridothelium virens]|uniref:Sec1-like protein n=1 Tax=Viridothelium virens TaxID=1048519 RepID=A0A6A6HLQ0_VIRVR|nr:Sec1-like protein [Viridothelium virens]